MIDAVEAAVTTEAAPADTTTTTTETAAVEAQPSNDAPAEAAIEEASATTEVAASTDSVVDGTDVGTTSDADVNGGEETASSTFLGE